jgi:large subunit ribosomal protein L9
MKLILTQEVTGLGAPGDIVEVKDGYGRNYLIPRNVAIRWTRGGEKQIESIKAARSSRAVRDLGKAEQIKAQLEANPVDVKVRAGEGGRLFGAVTVSDIASAINAAVGSGSGDVVDKRRILVGNPIKSLGAHQVTVKLHDELEATVQLNVVAA